MSEYLNKWFGIKNLEGIPNSQEREIWYIYSWNSVQCIDESDGLLTLYYVDRDITIHAKNDAVEERPAPVFLHDDTVLITRKQLKAVVKYTIWHFNGHYYYYILADEKGKMLKKRYMADELEILEKAK